MNVDMIREIARALFEELRMSIDRPVENELNALLNQFSIFRPNDDLTMSIAKDNGGVRAGLVAILENPNKYIPQTPANIFEHAREFGFNRNGYNTTVAVYREPGSFTLSNSFFGKNLDLLNAAVFQADGGIQYSGEMQGATFYTVEIDGQRYAVHEGDKQKLFTKGKNLRKNLEIDSVDENGYRIFSRCRVELDPEEAVSSKLVIAFFDTDYDFSGRHEGLLSDIRRYADGSERDSLREAQPYYNLSSDNCLYTLKVMDNGVFRVRPFDEDGTFLAKPEQIQAPSLKQVQDAVFEVVERHGLKTYSCVMDCPSFPLLRREVRQKVDPIVTRIYRPN